MVHVSPNRHLDRFGGFLAGDLSGPVAAVGDGYIDGTASFGETDVGDIEASGQIGHRLRLGELMEGLTGQSKCVMRHGILRGRAGRPYNGLVDNRHGLLLEE